MRREKSCKNCRNDDRLKRMKSLRGFLSRKVSQLKSARIKQGIEFTLTVDDCLEIYKEQLGVCAMSGLSLDYGTPHPDNKWESRNLSIDRIDCDGCYEVGNVQLICASINFMRGRLPVDVFIGLCERVAGRSG